MSKTKNCNHWSNQTNKQTKFICNNKLGKNFFKSILIKEKCENKILNKKAEETERSSRNNFWSF